MGSGEGVAVIAATSMGEAHTILKSSGKYNGYSNSYIIIETLELYQNYNVPYIIEEFNYTT